MTSHLMSHCPENKPPNPSVTKGQHLHMSPADGDLTDYMRGGGGGCSNSAPNAIAVSEISQQMVLFSREDEIPTLSQTKHSVLERTT